MLGKNSEFILNLPVYNNSTDIAYGAFMKRGVTGTQPYGALVPATGSSAHVNVVGRMLAKNVFATSGETLANGTAFVTQPVELAINGAKLWEVPYSLASGDNILCTQAVSTTTMSVTSLEDDIDTAFLYTAVGTGAGQTNYLTAAASGSCTLKAAFGTNLDTTTYFVKIQPRFAFRLALNSDGTKLVSQAAAGSWLEAMVLDSYITRNNRKAQLDPTKHAALTGLNSLRQFELSALLVVAGVPANNLA